MDDIWLPSLETRSPQEGIELAVKLSRLGMMLSQSSNDMRKESRAAQKSSRAQCIAAAHVIALNFQTIAAANDWWRNASPPQNGG
jgi:hexameric tyrosine-coordinated heme protein (HTHP)